MRMKKSDTLFNRSGKLFASLMVSIALIHFCIWYVYLNTENILLAFTPSKNNREFTLLYFEKIFNELRSPDTILYQALENALKYFFLGQVKLICGYLVAYFLYKKIFLHNVYTFVFFIPSMISSMVYIGVFRGIINTNGPIYMLLYNVFGYEMPHLLSSANTATPVIMFYTFWSGFGIQLMIFVGTMNRIPTEILEAAKLDGCSWLREFVQLILPMTAGVFLTYFLLQYCAIFMSSGPILYFTGMSEFLGTYTISFYIYAQTSSGQLNYASALGIVISLITLPITLIMRTIVNRLDGEVTY